MANRAELDPVGTGSYSIVMDEHILAYEIRTVRFQADAVIRSIKV